MAGEWRAVITPSPLVGSTLGRASGGVQTAVAQRMHMALLS